MKADELTNEQIRNLTPEQIEQIDALEPGADVDEYLAKPKATTDEQPEQTEQDGATSGAGDEDEETKDGEKPDESEEEDEPVVLNKSGKGSIPYSTLKGVRVENATLKGQLEEAQAKLQEMDKLKALLQEKQEAKGAKETDVADDAIANHLKVIEQDYPELHGSMSAIVESTKRQAEKLDKALADLQRKEEEAKRKEEEAKKAAEQSVLEQVNEARDNNPDLAHWHVNDKEAFDEAVIQDAAVRSSPKWAKATYAERFEEVVRRVRAVMPEASVPKTNNPKSAEQVQAKAKAKMDKAPVRRPTTLSDIPSGADPSSDKDLVENLTPGQLTSRLMKMPEQAQAAMRAGIPD